jgi:UDP-2,4-diacetamido-2,4,6-trideoxy-beta-L-altropyranose hydrolase
MRLALRVDASPRIGLGHVARCSALALAARARGAELRFVVRDLGLNTAATLRERGLGAVELPAPGPGAARPVPGAEAPAHAGWAEVDAAIDATQTAAALADFAPDWLLVDHYAFDAAWHRRVRAALGCRIAAIDDLADRPLDVDLLIDHNHSADHRAKYGVHLPPDSALLGGPRHALLGPDYANAPRCSPGDPVRSVGVFLGGADAGGHSFTALAALEAVCFAGAVEIATTSANPALDRLRRVVAARADTRLLLDAPHLAGFFARHDLQIGASGGATWERCCIGAPTLAVVVAENQRPVLEPLVALGVLVAADEAPPGVASLARGLRSLMDNPRLRLDLAAAARRLVDGHGAARVAAHLLQA